MIRFIRFNRLGKGASGWVSGGWRSALTVNRWLPVVRKLFLGAHAIGIGGNFEIGWMNQRKIIGEAFDEDVLELDLHHGADIDLPWPGGLPTNGLFHQGRSDLRWAGRRSSGGHGSLREDADFLPSIRDGGLNRKIVDDPWLRVSINDDLFPECERIRRPRSS